MPVSPAPTPILVVGRRALWPAPLEQLHTEGAICLDCVTDLYEAAARLATGGAFAAQKHSVFLIDPDHLTGREISMLCVLKRHVALPIGSLPSGRNRKEELRLQGILPWQEAMAALMRVLHNRSTPQTVKGSSVISQTADEGTERPSASPGSVNAGVMTGGTDRSRLDAAAKCTEMPVESEVVDRYDALRDGPILSEPEIRALLGSSPP
jgi:hypothetical protein